jgi:hypothetical protein
MYDLQYVLTTKHAFDIESLVLSCWKSSQKFSLETDAFEVAQEGKVTLQISSKTGWK